ncbi:hypothetical protein FA95DRAFT_1554759 [Auriscalpium vulgare]|uniref:Uncharacterized protein n=1 Tax=Auriscalpium vulgare TaxID=40419 RepID=A0ACB8S4V2_9AGAM|nr:hypothetical protein FA95DRAFT_1554759 [Auriscalpium vulgare]
MTLLPAQFFVLTLLADVYLYSIYSLLCCFTLVTLFRSIKGNVTSIFLVAATFGMYMVSTASVVLHAVDYIKFVALDSQKSLSVTVVDGLAYSLPTIHFILGDAIVVWRGWVIWQRNWRITAGPLVLLCGTTAVVLAQVLTTATSSGLLEAVSAPSAKLYLASLVLTLCTNGTVTVLIAYRAWIHYRSSRAIRIRVGRDRVLSVLLLLVESGALYCAIWITLIALWPSAVTQTPAFYVFANLLPQLTGMYPTVIIAICALRRSYADTVMSVPDSLTSITFAANGQPLARSSAAATRATRMPLEETAEVEVSLEGCSSTRRSSRRSASDSVSSVLQYVQDVVKAV